MPVAFYSGDGEGADLSDRMKGAAIVAEPFDPAELLRTVEAFRSWSQTWLQDAHAHGREGAERTSDAEVSTAASRT